MSDITVINDSQQSELVTNGLAKNGELYLKAAGSTDEGAVVVYDSGAWRTFANEAGPSFTNAYSVQLDGADDFVDLGDSTTIQDGSTGAFTWSMWLKFSPPASGIARIISRDNSGGSIGDRCFLLDIGNTNDLRIIIFEGGAVSVATWSGGASASNAGDNAWHHLAFVNEGSGSGTLRKIYFDGANQTLSGTTAGKNPDSNNQKLAIGASYEAGNPSPVGFPFAGLIDEVAAWPSALSASDITTIYNSGTPNDISSLNPVGWWRMGDNDGGTGTTITDQGSGGNNGTLTNGPTFSTDVPS